MYEGATLEGATLRPSSIKDIRRGSRLAPKFSTCKYLLVQPTLEPITTCTYLPSLLIHFYLTYLLTSIGILSWVPDGRKAVHTRILEAFGHKENQGPGMMLEFGQAGKPKKGLGTCICSVDCHLWIHLYLYTTAYAGSKCNGIC